MRFGWHKRDVTKFRVDFNYKFKFSDFGVQCNAYLYETFNMFNYIYITLVVDP